ncbi:MAG: phosphatase PAP2 family protein [Ardenticatenaceae bacterium]|nr:phosphatase PAP2 family protein [Ardenticatenaceae bacterium]MCB8948070.1 phosphatase PAP2 family protein [Ardenticatenaceae bacterium]
MNKINLSNKYLEPIYHFMSRLGKFEWRIYEALILVVGGVWGTINLTDEVLEGDTHAMDRRLLLSLREDDDPSNAKGPRWFEEMMRDFTALGGTGVLFLVVMAISSYLFMLGQHKNLAILLTAVLGGVILSYLLKGIFDRPRPELIIDPSAYNSASFPSGHSLLAAAIYLTLGSLTAQIQPRLRLKALIILISIFVMILVGFSRVYLGVHWPSDVLAGWAIGAVWALLCWLGSHWLQKREQEKADSNASTAVPD